MTIDPISAILSTYQPPRIVSSPFDEPHMPPIVWGSDSFVRVGRSFDCEN